MFTFGFFTTNLPYLFLGFGYLFYFVTATVNQEVADKWFAPNDQTIEISEADQDLHAQGCFDYHYCDNIKKAPFVDCTFAPAALLHFQKPLVADIQSAYYAPLYSRPPTV